MRRVEPIMGTVFSIEADEPVPTDDAVGWLRRVDEVFSTYRADSVVSRLGRGEIDLADCPPEVAEVLALCARARADSHGYFSATWNGRLDPTGLVKGWAIERASTTLRTAGSGRHAINGGGDVQTCGRWRTGVAHPLFPRAYATVITGDDLAIATSGTAERGPHVADPFTGHPAASLASVTVVGPSLTLADAYATAALAMGEACVEWLADVDGYEAFAVTAGGRAVWTPGYPRFGLVPDATGRDVAVNAATRGRR